MERMEIFSEAENSWKLEKSSPIICFNSALGIKKRIPNSVELSEISKEVYQKLAYRDTTEGILAVAKTKSHLLADLNLSDNPLILVAEGIEKPGNLGALLRTADAAKKPFPFRKRGGGHHRGGGGWQFGGRQCRGAAHARSVFAHAPGDNHPIAAFTAWPFRAREAR